MSVEELMRFKRKVRRDYWILFACMALFGLVNVTGFVLNRHAIDKLQDRCGCP